MNRNMCDQIYVFRKVDEGSKIWFRGEKQAYTVRASNVAFCILTKPFNARKTVLYTIIDWEQKVRGAENLIFGMGAETDEQCREMLERITNGESEVSSRRVEPLDIVGFKLPNKPKIYRKD